MGSANGGSRLPTGGRRARFDNLVANVAEYERDPLTAGVERYVGLDHLDGGSLSIGRWGSVTNGTTFTRKFRAGDVLFGKRRAYQRKAAVADFDGVCSGDLLVFRAKEGSLDPDLLPFIVQTDAFVRHALATSAGSLSPRTRWEDLARFEVPLPPPDRQRAIAELGWSFHDTVQGYQSALARVIVARRAAFEAFAMRAAHTGHVGPLRDALKCIVAGRSPQGRGEPAKSEEYGVLKVSAVGADGFVESENKVLVNADEFRSEFEVQAGFLLVTRANAAVEGVARACLVGGTRPGLMLSDKTLRLVSNVNVAGERYLLEALRSQAFRRHVVRETGGTEARNISQSRLAQGPVPLPPIDEQQDMLGRLDKFDAEEQSLRRQILTTQRFQSLAMAEVLWR